jgi:hypothetical protein
LTKLLSPQGEVSNKLGYVMRNADNVGPVLDGSCFSRTCKQIEANPFYTFTMMFLVFVSCVGVGISVTHGGMYSKWVYSLHLAAFALFVIEVAIKIGSLSLSKGSYLDACETYLLEDKWNLLDTLVVAFALIELLPYYTEYIPVKGIMVLRSCHLLRMMHNHKFLPRLRSVFDSFGVGLKTAFFLMFMQLIFNYTMVKKKKKETQKKSFVLRFRIYKICLNSKCITFPLNLIRIFTFKSLH